MKYTIKVMFFLLLCSSSLWAETLSGKAYDNGRKMIFNEVHDIDRENGEISGVFSRYYYPNGNLMAEMITKPSAYPYVPNVSFKRYGKELESGCFLQNGFLVLYKKQPGHSQPKIKKLAYKEDMLLGHGLFFYITQQFSRLESKEILKFSYVIPNRLTAHPFKIWGNAHPKKPNVFVVHLKIDNWLLKSFVPEIHFNYDQRTRQLLNFEGFNGFLFDEDKPPKLFIEYTYSNLAN